MVNHSLIKSISKSCTTRRSIAKLLSGDNIIHIDYNRPYNISDAIVSVIDYDQFLAFSSYDDITVYDEYNGVAYNLDIDDYGKFVNHKFGIYNRFLQFKTAEQMILAKMLLNV